MTKRQLLEKLKDLRDDDIILVYDRDGYPSPVQQAVPRTDYDLYGKDCGARARYLLLR